MRYLNEFDKFGDARTQPHARIKQFCACKLFGQTNNAPKWYASIYYHMRTERAREREGERNNRLIRKTNIVDKIHTKSEQRSICLDFNHFGVKRSIIASEPVCV